LVLFQDFSDAIERENGAFNHLVESCGLLETPFDQSQFESDVGAMADKVKQCERVCGDAVCRRAVQRSVFIPIYRGEGM
jgi:hypothetical protein